MLRLSLMPPLLVPLVRGELGPRIGFAAVALLLLLGLFTRSTSIVLVVIVLAATLWALWNGAPPLFDSFHDHWMVAAVSVALALVGPGAYSVDSRRFGWRELTVPNA